MKESQSALPNPFVFLALWNRNGSMCQDVLNERCIWNRIVYYEKYIIIVVQIFQMVGKETHTHTHTHTLTVHMLLHNSSFPWALQLRVSFGLLTVWCLNNLVFMA
jgi:hypothetical protein